MTFVFLLYIFILFRAHPSSLSCVFSLSLFHCFLFNASLSSFVSLSCPYLFHLPCLPPPSSPLFALTPLYLPLPSPLSLPPSFHFPLSVPSFSPHLTPPPSPLSSRRPTPTQRSPFTPLVNRDYPPITRQMDIDLRTTGHYGRELLSLH